MCKRLGHSRRCPVIAVSARAILTLLHHMSILCDSFSFLQHHIHIMRIGIFDPEENDTITFINNNSATTSSWDTRAGELDSDILEALEKRASYDASSITAFREEVLSRIESRAAELRQSGACSKWLAGGCEAARQVCQEVNGPLFEELASQAQVLDRSAAQVLRDGARLTGKLPLSGYGDPFVFPEPESVQTLKANVKNNNAQLIASLKPDSEGEALFKATAEDAAKGRMTPPMPLRQGVVDNILLARRFSVTQRNKVRPIDDASANGLNACCQPSEKLHHDRLDKLVSLIKWWYHRSTSELMIWKADIDAAYRRVPVADHDKPFAGVVFKTNDQVWFAVHHALPFGCVGSVHGWDRIGQSLQVIARRLLHIPALRYVDDFFSAEPEQTAAHAMDCFARLVRAILGQTAIAAKKLEVGKELVVLGIKVAPVSQGIKMSLEKSKSESWVEELQPYKYIGMPAGVAAQFAGRFNFASGPTFRRMGRAMVRPFYAQQYKPFRHAGKFVNSPQLKLAIQWWEAVLQYDVAEQIDFNHSGEFMEMYCDARSKPPRVAAVLLSRGHRPLYTDWEPPDELVQLYTEVRQS